MTQKEQPPRQVGIQSNSGGDINIEQSQVNIAGRDVVHVHQFRSWEDALREGHRKKLLEMVHTFWIRGVLTNSLQGMMFLELGMTEKPDAVDAWKRLHLDQASQGQPSVKKILEVFNESAGELLILGAPGSGKTTMLLDL